jgi:flagellar basal-body rod protein FlgB
MINISSIVDLGGMGLSVEKVKSYVASENIANANNPNYAAKSIDFKSLLDISENLNSLNLDGDALQNNSAFIEEHPGKKVALDEEVLHLSDAELRFQVISDIIQRKFGMMDLVYGAKK